MNRTVLVVLIWVFVTSCSAVRVGSGVPPIDYGRARLATARTAADSLYLREMTGFMEIVDPDHWRDHLRHVNDLTTFRTDIEAYFTQKDIATRPDTPHRNEWREEMEKRLEWCRANLSTPIDAPVPDVRWGLVLRNGVPAAAWRSTTSRPIGTRGPFIFEIYNMIWPALGLAVSCELSDLGNLATDYGPLIDWGWVTDEQENIEITPDMHAAMTLQKQQVQAEMNEPSRFIAFPGLKQIINTNLAPLIFPNDDGTSDLWVATLTRGDQFSDSTIRSDRFDVELTVYNQSQQLTGRDSVSIAGLRQIGTVPDIEEVAVPAYVGCPRLEPGYYEYVVSLRGVNESNLGVYRDTITIPPRRALRGASDVMIAFTPGVASGRGIARRGLQLHANPSRSYTRSDSFSVYVEFPENLIPGEEYRVTVSLIPQKNPLASWQPIKVRERTLLSGVFPRTALDGKFLGSISLEEAKRGRYFLSVQIASQLEDPPGEEPVMAWTEIEVK